MKTDHSKKFEMHRLISILITLTGIAFMTIMVIAEDEPGAIPLLLIVIGAGWFFTSRVRFGSQHKQELNSPK